MAEPAQIISCSSECTVTVQLAPAPPSADNIADIATVGGLLMVFLVVVWGAKQLMRLVISDES